MPAPKGNNNAELWTEDKSLKFMKEALKTLKNDKEIMFIGSLAVKQSTYRQIYQYITDKFKGVEFNTIKKEINNIIETRLFESALTNSVNSTVAIFGLKNNHKWKDKFEFEGNTKTEINLTPSQIKEINNNLDEEV